MRDPTTVLIVDDDQKLTENLEDILGEEGYTVFSTPTCTKALELAMVRRPQTAILDLKLPDGLGTSLLKELKRLDPDCVCIIATAYADLDSALAAMEGGAFHYLQKPVRPSELLLILQRVSEAISIREEKRTSDERLRESEKQYRDVVENANCIILRSDPAGIILFMNSYGLTFFGYSKEEIIGRSVFDTIAHETGGASEKDVGASPRQFLRYPEGCEVAENENMKKDGTHVWVSWANKAIFDDQGNLVEILSIGIDSTEKKIPEAQLLLARTMEAVGTLAGGVAHDFNNILQVVQGYSEFLLLGKTEADPECRQLGQIRNAAQRGAALTHQLLTFSREVESNLHPVSPKFIVTKSSKLIEKMIPRTIDIHLHLSPGLNTVLADTAQIEQVLVNLALNAVDSMEGGGTLIIAGDNATLDETFCNTRPGLKPGKHVLLTVSDTGRGMNRDILKRIFDPFFTIKGLAKGKGLGLAIAYGIVRNHGGHIECLSEPGAGTTFRIYLPAVEQVVDPGEQAVDTPT
jgi:two-component system cell cycle sensor histidine kinase/response regulator CckA